MSILIGYYQGKGEKKEYDLTVKNIKLQNKVEKLEAEKSETVKSFVKQVAESSPTQECVKR